MSENVKSQGFMAEIVGGPVDYEEVSEKLYDNSTLRINYDGTLIYSDETEDKYDTYGMTFLNTRKEDKQIFLSECLENNISIDVSSIKSYVCIWYNGVDSDMSTMTLEKFKGEK